MKLFIKLNMVCVCSLWRVDDGLWNGILISNPIWMQDNAAFRWCTFEINKMDVSFGFAISFDDYKPYVYIQHEKFQLKTGLFTLKPSKWLLLNLKMYCSFRVKNKNMIKNSKYSTELHYFKPNYIVISLSMNKKSS